MRSASQKLWVGRGAVAAGEVDLKEAFFSVKVVLDPCLLPQKSSHSFQVAIRRQKRAHSSKGVGTFSMGRRGKCGPPRRRRCCRPHVHAHYVKAKRCIAYYCSQSALYPRTHIHRISKEKTTTVWPPKRTTTVFVRVHTDQTK